MTQLGGMSPTEYWRDAMWQLHKHGAHAAGFKHMGPQRGSSGSRRPGKAAWGVVLRGWLVGEGEVSLW